MTCDVTFLPEGRRWRGEAPVPLGLAAAACDIVLEQPCGSRASCGRCRVRIPAGTVADEADLRVLGADAVTDGWRLGCRVVIDRDTTVEVPWSARVVAHKSFGGDDLLRDGFTPVAAAGWGIALDVGSTTLAAAVVDLASGDVASTAAVLNRQVSFGPDIMSRIAFALRHAGGSAELHRALLAGVNEVVAEAVLRAGVDVAEVGELVAVGNTTMLHTLAALPLGTLGVAPFQGVRYEAWQGPAAALDLALPSARVLLLPCIRAHVGADTVAAALAMRLDRAAAPTLLLDLGTNTEVVLASSAGIVCTSAAAGPAFEGASIRFGTRAVPGAIDQLRVTDDGQVLLHTVDDRPAIGICGSGIVDAVAELVRVGAIERSGRMRPAAEQPLPGLAARIVEADGERALRLGDGPRPVLLTARDVRELQLARGGIAAAVRLLLEDTGLAPADLAEVLVAGTFGSYVRLASALAIGLLPHVPPERVRFVGNAAGAGARLALVDVRARERAGRLARAARFVELAGRADYQEAFVAMLPFPETT